MSSDFLSGQNVNYVLNQLFSNLEYKGVSLNPKDEQGKILNFMQKCQSNYPRQPIIQLNNYVIKALTDHYLKSQPPRSNIESRLEQEMAERKYRNLMSPPPNQQTTGYLTVDQARGISPINGQGAPASEVGRHFDREQQRQREENMTLEERVAERERLRREGHDIEQGKPLISGEGRLAPNFNNDRVTPQLSFNPQKNGRSIWISLSKDNLVNMSDNVLTFSWDPKLYRKILGRGEGSRGGCQITLEHLTLPKYYPFILVKNKNSENNVGIYNASGKGFEMKLVPVQRLQENTSYRQLGRGFLFSRKPSTLSLQLSSGDADSGALGLNLIPVLKVTKIKHRIKIQTKYPHNLHEADFLVLEFPEMASCYKVTNLKILDPYQIEVDSPFSGYMSSNFRLIRNNWDLDLTLKIDL